LTSAGELAAARRASKENWQLMSTIKDLVAVKSFVREKLGCGCPDSVFEQIDYQEHAAILGHDASTQRLLIGNSLLIYILESNDEQLLQAHLPRLIKMAREERDKQGYHRLRVVLVTEQAESLRTTVERLFASFPEVDERVHLHVYHQNPMLDLG